MITAILCLWLTPSILVGMAAVFDDWMRSLERWETEGPS